VFDGLKKGLGLGQDKAPVTSQRVPPAVQGAYRLHHADDIARLTGLAKEAFPQFASRINCFAADWLGRQFATDTGRIVDGEPQVLLLELGTGEALEIPASVDSFHSRELVDHAEACVALAFYRRWLAGGGVQPAYDQCIGYKRPLHLGGADDVENLELSDFDVYWTIAGQLLAKTRGIPSGTRIGRVSIGD
jgi:hypothetical protein